MKKLLKKTLFYKLYRKHINKRRQELQKKENMAFINEAETVLKHFSDALMSNGILFWLDYGTLLGYYREHDFIKHDFDLDTGAWFTDHDKIKAALENNGFKRIRYYYLKNRNGLEECYRFKDYFTTIDVFYYFNDNDKSYCFSFAPMVSMSKKRHLNKEQPSKVRKWTFNRINPIAAEFKGVKVYVPENTGDYLKSTYGDTFMTPIPNYPLNRRPNMTEYTYDECPACAFFSVGWVC